MFVFQTVTSNVKLQKKKKKEETLLFLLQNNFFGTPKTIQCWSNMTEKIENGSPFIINASSATNGNSYTLARGVRNSVGMGWHPATDVFYFTDNGRDGLGNDIPDCKLNKLSKVGEHFGFPYCHSEGSGDPYLRDLLVTSYTYNNNSPHTAPLGMLFYTGSMFPTEYTNAIFVNQHGSWNRDVRIGYRTMVLKMSAKSNFTEIGGFEVFLEGWLHLPQNTYWGRPVDVLQLPDGSILISDDYNSVIYRVFYQTNATMYPFITTLESTSVATMATGSTFMLSLFAFCLALSTFVSDILLVFKEYLLSQFSDSNGVLLELVSYLDKLCFSSYAMPKFV
ncbi:putative membrane-bound dehydrogenase [Reticulomyxa filosa]|uniref:Putative membrane-bound dehydrogenase n=1 Tax=Reticulomyxa filosa TaxID=46433 RepID=X6NN65_RETFI|nr:putative membrane-bound dehydrogenase [Reticulomyxa filosa]|eukprot:ETO27159.1 putative membrane-bound dehydrogenase [Reticulomyxa filosa]